MWSWQARVLAAPSRLSMLSLLHPMPNGVEVRETDTHDSEVIQQRVKQGRVDKDIYVVQIRMQRGGKKGNASQH